MPPRKKKPTPKKKPQAAKKAVVKNPVGKPKGYKTPDEIWKTFLAYKKHVKDNPRIRIDYVGKDGDRVETEVEQPLTVEGFKCYCADNQGDINRYWNNRDNEFGEYAPIIARVREEIRQEQITGGMTGFYHPNLTARLNGLGDKQQIEATANINILSNDPLGDSKE